MSSHSVRYCNDGVADCVSCFDRLSISCIVDDRGWTPFLYPVFFPCQLCLELCQAKQQDDMDFILIINTQRSMAWFQSVHEMPCVGVDTTQYLKLDSVLIQPFWNIFIMSAVAYN